MRLNSGSIKDLITGQASKRNNRNAKSSSRRTILVASQRSAGGNILSEDKNMQLPDSQKVPTNPDIMSIGDLIKIDALLGNEKSGGEKKLLLRLNNLKRSRKRLK